MSIALRTVTRALAATAVALLAGCGSVVEPQGAAPPQTTPAVAASPIPSLSATDTVTQLPCAELQEPLARLLEQDVVLSEATVSDLKTGQARAGCRLEAMGTAAQWGDFVTASKNLALVLTQRGWGPGTALADGPTGTVVGFAKDAARLQLAVDWRPGPAVSCPADQPIAACDVPPEQQLITIRLEGF